MQAQLALLVATLAAGAVVCQAELDVPHDYLALRDNLPLAESPFRREVLAMMEAHPLASSEPGKMLETIKSARHSTSDLKEMDFFEELLDLSEHDGRCTPNLRRYVLAIMSLAQEVEAEAVRGYLTYVKSQARGKYGACARTTGEEFELRQRQLAHKDEEALDELFMAYTNSKHTLEDLALIEAAKGANFATDAYKTKRMLKVARDFMPVAEHERPRAPLEQLARFVPHACARMQEPLKNVLANFNLARAFGAKITTTGVPVRFLKLNEYNRACLTWQNDPAGAGAHLERRLKASKWYKF